MQEICDSLEALSLGAPQAHGNLALYPLLGELAAGGRVVHLAGYALS